jgi:hypothetical protein
LLAPIPHNISATIFIKPTIMSALAIACLATCLGEYLSGLIEGDSIEGRFADELHRHGSPRRTHYASRRSAAAQCR